MADIQIKRELPLASHVALSDSLCSSLSARIYDVLRGAAAEAAAPQTVVVVVAAPHPVAVEAAAGHPRAHLPDRS
jgi:hypothetical protein